MVFFDEQRKPQKFLDVFFFRESSGREPVLEWLRTLPKDERENIGNDLQTLQYSWPVGMPLVRSLGKGLWELRSSLRTRIARLIFLVDSSPKIVVLHGFIKKTQKTPQADLVLALNRAKQL